MSSSDPPHNEPEAAVQLAAQSEAVAALRLARANAIQCYASLEQSLWRLLAELTTLDEDIAGTIFFRIVNTRSRMSILEYVAKRKANPATIPFLNSAFKRCEQLDQTRNGIIHWHQVIELSWPIRAELCPPNYYARTADTKCIQVSDLKNFSKETDFLSRSLNMYCFSYGPKWAAHNRELGPWLDIFQQPMIYPPPASHPLAQTLLEPGSQPRS